MSTIINGFEQGVVNNRKERVLLREIIFFDMKRSARPKPFPPKNSVTNIIKLSAIILVSCCVVYILETYTPEQVISILRLAVDLIKALG